MCTGGTKVQKPDPEWLLDTTLTPATRGSKTHQSWGGTVSAAGGGVRENKHGVATQLKVRPIPRKASPQQVQRVLSVAQEALRGEDACEEVCGGRS